MVPVLTVLSTGDTYSAKQLRERIAGQLGLTDDDLEVTLAKGKQSVFANRVGWAVTYLAKAGAVERPTRGNSRITDRGRGLLAEHPDRIVIKYLSKYPEFEDFRSRRESTSATTELDVTSKVENLDLTPSEQIQTIVDGLDQDLESDLLARVYDAGDSFLETLSLQLLRRMGYGGPAGHTEHTGKSGDEGIDGIIRQDALGLDRIGIQAKCYKPESTIGRPALQAFAGALHGAQTQRGVFVTTATYTAGAITYAQSVNLRIILIDGPELAKLMIEHKLGVAVSETFELHQVETDYFEA